MTANAIESTGIKNGLSIARESTQPAMISRSAAAHAIENCLPFPVSSSALFVFSSSESSLFFLFRPWAFKDLSFRLCFLSKNSETSRLTCSGFSPSRIIVPAAIKRKHMIYTAVIVLSPFAKFVKNLMRDSTSYEFPA